MGVLLFFALVNLTATQCQCQAYSLVLSTFLFTQGIFGLVNLTAAPHFMLTQAPIYGLVNLTATANDFFVGHECVCLVIFWPFDLTATVPGIMLAQATTLLHKLQPPQSAD